MARFGSLGAAGEGHPGGTLPKGLVDTEALVWDASLGLWMPATATTSGQVLGRLLEASGNGAGTARARLVGGNNTGAPASGSYVLRDFTITSDGALWVNTAAGAPGTWIAAAVGALVGAQGRYIGQATTAPLSGTFALGDYFVGSSSGSVIVGICTASGTPGTWLVATVADKASSSTQTFTAEVAAPSVAANLSGASGRFVGYGSAAPVSGTFLTGDYIIGTATTASGVAVYVCTAGGSPGTWVSAVIGNALQIQGRNVSSSSPSSGQVYAWNGVSQWVPVSPSPPNVTLQHAAGVVGSDVTQTVANTDQELFTGGLTGSSLLSLTTGVWAVSGQATATSAAAASRILRAWVAPGSSGGATFTGSALMAATDTLAVNQNYTLTLAPMILTVTVAGTVGLWVNANNTAVIWKATISSNGATTLSSSGLSAVRIA